MKIERLQVEEGFLDGLNLPFSDGLNVLIGPRGAGKTSVIELLRFCLDAAGFSERSQSPARQHALSVLESGEVTVTLTSDAQRIVVTRSATDEHPRSTADFYPPLIFSQNEIESLGLQASSRLRLIDEFRPARGRSRDRAHQLRVQVRSLTLDARGSRAEISQMEERLNSLGALRVDLASAEGEQESLVKSIGDSEGRWHELDLLTSRLAEVAVREGVYARVSQELDAWSTRLRGVLVKTPAVEEWPATAGGADPLQEIRSILDVSVHNVQSASDTLGNASASLSMLRQQNREQQIGLEEKARDLRRELEHLKSGGTAVTKRISTLREQIGQLEALQPLVEKKRTEHASIIERRDHLLDELDTLCEDEFNERNAVADRLNTLLGPTIRVSVERFGIQTGYVNAIRNVLRGTGLHYNALAPVLAERMSPREVVEAVERDDYKAISEASGIPIERAARLIGELANTGTEELLVCELEDSVTLSLLDGGEYKSTEHLSTGQRCTVILPLLLAKEDRVLIIDQPEDHLDNAFIVGTAIEAIRKRKHVGQLVFSTHNPNIPVLGEASEVILMGSDGQHGFVRHAGALDEPASVQAITAVMEGGIEAFHRRAEFYDEQSS
jgi:energy-coupling factor transporter ATP-binding protein EcfA2